MDNLTLVAVLSVAVGIGAAVLGIVASKTLAHKPASKPPNVPKSPQPEQIDEGWIWMWVRSESQIMNIAGLYWRPTGIFKEFTSWPNPACGYSPALNVGWSQNYGQKENPSPFALYDWSFNGPVSQHRADGRSVG